MPPRLLLASLLAIAAIGAQAQSFRCVGKDGKRYYGQTIPPQCAGVPVEQLGADGRLVRRIDPPAPAADEAARKAEAEEKKKREAALKEEQRRARALLATYTSEADIEAARKRALAENEKAVKETETRIAALRKREEELKKELEFFQGKNKPPAKLEQDIRDNAFAIETQEKVLAQRRKEADHINARYDEDRRRYLELTKGSARK
jgi:hypothetical protein